MAPKVLHVLSQRPSRTGSGITLDAVVRLAEKAGWLQAVVVGVPQDDDQLVVGRLKPQDIHPVRFLDDSGGSGPADLDFAVPGMSDVMPYPSTVWSTLGPQDLASYRRVWTRHLEMVIRKFKPDLIHSNHIWLVSSLLKDVAPHLPVVTTCHATGLRQLQLCPHLAPEVISGCSRNEYFLVLRKDHKTLLAQTLGIAHHQISVTGVGFRDEIFHAHGAAPVSRRRDFLYVGKFSEAKGLPWLLDAFENLNRQMPNLRLHVAGSGSGPEAEILRARMETMAPAVIMHGMLDQDDLAQLMRQCATCILPSFYEGVPLVLIEAAACGCHLISTQLPGVVEQIAPVLGNTLEMIPLPRLSNVDKPLTQDLPIFTEKLVFALKKSLLSPQMPPANLDCFTWNTVFCKVESIWQSILI